MGRYRGAARLRRVIEQLGVERTDSGLERDVRRLLRSARLRPAPCIHELRADGVLVASLRRSTEDLRRYAAARLQSTSVRGMAGDGW